MNKDFTGFDEMVEALEENEDMVECKECFDLVPKVDCERAEVGYICPTCRGLRTAPAQARFVDPYDSYTQDFPEVTEYDPGSVIEYEKEPGLGDALSDLIRDEYEAIDGYEAADETVQHADIDEDEKDEILDTLDHIKEEEEEHIDELKELCPECDKEVEEPSDKALVTDSTVCEKLDIDLSNCIDSSDMEIWGVEPAGKDTYKAVLLKRFENVSFRGNDEIDKVESEMFDLGGLFVFYFGKNGMPELDRWDPELLRSLSNCEIIFEDDRYDQACERTLNRSTSQVEELKEAADDEEAAEEAEVEEIPEEDIPAEEAEDSEENENEEVSDLDSAYEAALEIANESGVGQVFGYARKETEEFVAIEPFEVDDPEAVEDDLMAVYDDVAYAYVAYPEKELEESLFESVQLNEGPLRWLKGIGQKIGNTVGHLSNKDSGKLIDKFFNEGYILWFEPAKKGAKLKLPEEHKEEYQLADQAITAAKHLSKEYPEFKLWVFAKAIDVADLSNREKKVADVKGDKGAIIACFRNGTVLIQKDKEIADELNKIAIDHKDLAKTTGKTQGGGSSDPRGAEEPEETDEVEEDLDALKAAAKETLGELKAADAYTPESYKKYEVAYKKIIAWIEAHTKPEALTQERIDNLRKQAEAKLVAAPDEDPNLDDDEEEVTGDSVEDTTALDEAKAKAKEALGEKKAAEGYTKDSYAAYSENYDKVVAAIESATSEEELKKIVDQIPKLNKMLDVDDTPEDDTFAVEIDETSEEEADTETEDEDSTGEEKISEISDDRLIKLYQVLSGRQISSNAGVAKSQLKRLRQKLASLGESIDNNSSDEELLEVLQSEAEAVKSLKDTAASLKSTASSMQNMTSAMREEYHKYANPAELKAMEDIENLVTGALSNIYSNLATWGYEANETDSQCWMCQENEACLQYMIDFEDLDDDEAEDLADQLQVQLENELSVYKPVPEIEGIAGSIALPDYDIAYDDDDEDFKGITRASILVYVTFARNLF